MAAQDAGWKLAVASTSAEASVRAILEHAVGPERARRFDAVLAGDVVPRKKPAPDIYELALERLAVPPETVLVIEDSRNGLLAATCRRAALPRHGQRLHRGRGQPARPCWWSPRWATPTARRQPCWPIGARRAPGRWVTLDDLEACLRA